jgi:hypothetical protein
VVIDASRELLAALVGREDVSEEDIAVGAYEVHLTASCLFVNCPFSDEDIGLLRLDGEELLAGIVQYSNFLLDTHKDAHFGQLYLIDVKIVHVVPILRPSNGSVVVYRKQRQVVQPRCAKHIPIGG